MSFSGEIKEELSKISNLANKEQVKKEAIGYLITNNTTAQKGKIRYCTENEYNINRFHKLLTNLGISYDIQMQGKNYVITFKKQEFNFLTYQEDKLEIKEEAEEIDLLKEEAGIKALIRGAFLGGGSLNNPNNTYHLEILFSTSHNAIYVSNRLKEFGIQTKLLTRKNSYSVYSKDSEEISKFLALMGANKGVLSFEEIRVVRETRNNVNRLVNCETANLNKTINAAVEQINAIMFLKEQGKFEKLPDGLKEIAKVRLKNPDANLVELGELLVNPIGKSGVNHRLKKLCQIAEELKKEI